MDEIKNKLLKYFGELFHIEQEPLIKYTNNKFKVPMEVYKFISIKSQEEFDRISNELSTFLREKKISHIHVKMNDYRDIYLLKIYKDEIRLYKNKVTLKIKLNSATLHYKINNIPRVKSVSPIKESFFNKDILDIAIGHRYKTLYGQNYRIAECSLFRRNILKLLRENNIKKLEQVEVLFNKIPRHFIKNKITDKKTNMLLKIIYKLLNKKQVAYNNIKVF